MNLVIQTRYQNYLKSRLVKNVLNIYLFLFVFVSLGQAIFSNDSFYAMPDDAFIFFRYVENFLSGNGLVFNAGEKVEGISSLVWTFLLAFFSFFNFESIVVISKLLGIAFAAATLTVAFNILFYIVHNKVIATIFSIFIFLLLVNDDSVQYWAVSGMETFLFVFLIAGIFYLLFKIAIIRKQCCSRSFLLYLALFFVTFTRPEGVFYFLGFHVLIAVGDTVNRRLGFIYSFLGFPFLLSISAIMFVVFLRYMYYGALLPNTAIVKSSGAVRMEYLKNGWDYSLDFFAQPLMLFLITIVVFSISYFVVLCRIGGLKEVRLSQEKSASIREWVPLLLALLFVVGSPILMSLKSGGDWMANYRFFLAAKVLLIVFSAICLSLVVQSVISVAFPKLIGKWNTLKIVTIIIFVSVGWMTYSSYEFFGNMYAALNKREIGGKKVLVDWVSVIKSRNPERALLAVTEVGGAIPFYLSDVNFIEYFGLTDRYIARNGRDAFPMGKVHNEYLESRKPDFLIFNNKKRAKSLFNGVFGGGRYYYVDIANGYAVLLAKNLNEARMLADWLAAKFGSEVVDQKGNGVDFNCANGIEFDLGSLHGNYPFVLGVVNMWWNGSIRSSVSLGKGHHIMLVKARGSYSGGEFSKMRINISEENMDVIFERSIELTTQPKIYRIPFTVNDNGEYTTIISFVNDHKDETGDRNAYIYGICIE